MKEKEPETLEELIGQTIGHASMLWSETPKGVFESTQAKNLMERVVSEIRLRFSNGLERENK